MTVAFVAAQSATTSTSGSKTVFSSVNFGAANFALVLIATDGTDTTTGVTINGVSATLAHRTSASGGFTGMAAYRLANPTNGNVVVTSSSVDWASIGLLTFSGVDTTTPLGTWVETANQSGTSGSTGTITGVDANGMFLDFANFYTGGSAASVTWNGSESQQVLQQGPFTTQALGVTTKAGSASTTVGFASSTNVTRYNLAGVYIRAGGGATTRGMPFGSGVAFNGGRTLTGVMR